MHVLRYDYDEATDQVPVLDRAEVTIRLAGGAPSSVSAVPDGVGADIVTEDTVTRLKLRNLPLYSVFLLS